MSLTSIILIFLLMVALYFIIHKIGEMDSIINDQEERIKLLEGDLR